MSKTFAGQRALDEVSLTIQQGEIHALVGQNGAGKSTLIKILAGFHEPDPGSHIQLNGADFDPRRQKSEIGFVHQDLALVPTMSAVDNIALVRGFETDRSGGIRWKLERRRSEELVAAFGVELDVTVPIIKLSPVQRAIVAMARATQGGAGNARLLVLDEPTAALPAREVRHLLDAVRRFAAGGGGVLYVSHRLDEVFQVSERVTVLRGGRAVTTQATCDVTQAELVAQMLGRPLEDMDWRHHQTVQRTQPLLEVTNLSGGRVHRLDLDVAPGEVIGVAGIVGSGREDVASLLFGAEAPVTGRVAVSGQLVRAGSPRSSLAHGMAYVPRDRLHRGLVMSQSVRENMLLPRLKGFFGRFGQKRRQEHEEVSRWMSRLGVVPADPDRSVALLSGGNQQKVVFAKALGLDPRVLVLDEPVQGVDVGAKRRLFELVAQAAEAGISVVVCTAELEDLPLLCDRVLVMRGGVVAEELCSPAITEHRLLELTIDDESDFK